ncbi:hypothetical protein M0813_18181 [Anaeramoeba flamelloides]|uniref:Uncharacterized protein n=1 Tax=Anaeramoeba flamelloides TaxID=1746091 RepID=A0ABQ8YTY5_9EUKA|nr:hypothetical protein M0813_18181 [Anaeramoeba flamelloides]
MKFVKVFSFVFLVFFSLQFVDCRINDFEIENDERQIINIENFGFLNGGEFKIEIESLTLTNNQNANEANIGFILESTGEISEEDEDTCQKFHQIETPTFHVINQPENGWKNFKIKIPVQKEGFYQLWYLNCLEVETTTSLVSTITMKNKSSYLDAGEIPLPKIYVTFFFFYFVLLVLWISFQRKKNKKVFKIHHLMTALLVSKSLSILCRSIELHMISSTGLPKGANIPYYIFHFFKGVLLFVVILLVGTGWSFIKNTLNERDKKIFIFIIPAQIISNIAIIVLDETLSGTKGYLQWWDILKFFDLVCVCCIIFPIIYTISHLQSTASVDGKMAKNVERLKIFKEFYIVTFVYIYTTRLFVMIIPRFLSFKVLYIDSIFDELVTFFFYLYVGYRFRPIQDNTYMSIYNDSFDETDEDTVIIDLEQFDDENETLKRVKKDDETDDLFEDDDFEDDDDDDDDDKSSSNEEEN